MQLHKGFEAEYKKRHDEIWPRLSDLLTQTGVSDYYIFLDEETNALFGTLLISSESKFNDLPSHPVMQEWWAYMKDIMQSNPDNSPVSTPLTQVFYLP